MQELQILEQNDGLYVDSREVAKELGKRPSDVSISLNNILTNGDFRSLIIPSEYKDKKYLMI